MCRINRLILHALEDHYPYDYTGAEPDEQIFKKKVHIIYHRILQPIENHYAKAKKYHQRVGKVPLLLEIIHKEILDRRHYERKHHATQKIYLQEKRCRNAEEYNVDNQYGEEKRDVLFRQAYVIRIQPDAQFEQEDDEQEDAETFQEVWIERE